MVQTTTLKALSNDEDGIDVINLYDIQASIFNRGALSFFQRLKSRHACIGLIFSH